jgi:tyrocidine synthetase-3
MLDLVESLKTQNVSIWACDGKIKLAYGEQSPSQDLVGTIKSQKSEILEFLDTHKIVSQTAFDNFFNKEKDTQKEATESNSIEAIYPASSLQQGFIYHHLNNQSDDAYRVQLLLDYNHSLDIKIYQQAWRLASIRYPILRMGFNWDEDILQVFTSLPSINEDNFSIIDLSASSPDSLAQEIEAIQKQDRNVPFELSKPGLIRVTLIKTSENSTTVLKTEHHSIADGWGGAILLDTVHQYYNDLVKGITPLVEPETAYLEAQEYHLNQQENAEKYWNEKKQTFSVANNINPLLSRPFDQKQTKVVSLPAEQTLTLVDDSYTSLKASCQKMGITLNVALQFAWHKLLHLYSRDEQTIVGTTVSGRDIDVEGVESSVGLYINTLPLAVDWNKGQSIEQVLGQIQLSIAALNSYSSISLAALQQGEERLFHSLFVFENYPVSLEESVESDGIENYVSFRQAVEKVDYPICFTSSEQNNSLAVTLKYDQKSLDKVQAQRLLSQIQLILTSIVETPSASHDAIPTMNESEKCQVLQTWNNTESPYPENKTLVELFSKQASLTPDKVALVCDEESLTYQQVEHLSNQIAHSIRANFQNQSNKTFETDSLVALYLDRSSSMLINILAVLKTGAAYVPISPEDPQQRVEYILKDTQACIVLTQQNYLSKLQQWTSEFETKPVLMANEDPSSLSQYSTDTPVTNYQPDSLAYVIYTSGTSGQPKGVMVENSSVVAFVFGNKYLELDSVDRVASLSPYSFDGFVFDSFFSLLHGASCYLFAKDTLLDLDKFAQDLNKYQIDTFFTTTALFNQIIKNKTLKNSQVCNVLFGGEAANINVIQRALTNHPKIKFTHVYGPTESVVFTTAYQFSNETINAPIGSGLSNKKLYVLDESGAPLAQGMQGELHIGGAGIARGYLNQPELTQQKFIANPFASENEIKRGHKTLYKTGDIVRWLADGNLEFIGRNDAQVKVRGHRIELEEIQTALTELASIEQAIVIVKQQGEATQYLAAYLVIASGEQLDVELIRENLHARLPEYLVPTTFTAIDEIPLTNNGKLNKDALPEPEIVNLDNYVAPRNELEKKLCKVWQTVFTMEEKIGVYDNFFTLGGNSITAIRLTATSQRDIGIEIPLALLFKLKTIAGLASHLTEQELIVIPPTSLSRPPLSFAQERLLFIEQFEQGSDSYHIPLFLQLSKNVDLRALEESFNLVVERHPVLKTVYPSDDNDINYQSVLDQQISIEWDTLAESESLYGLVRTKIGIPFHLDKQPSIRLSRITKNEEDYLLIVWHHIAFDGWSTDIFMQELALAYDAISQNQTPNLPALAINYADYSAWQREYLQGDTLDKLNQYWQAHLADLETLNLPTDHRRPAQIDYRGKDIGFELDGRLSGQLRELAKSMQTTLNSLLLSGFYATLAQISGQKDIVVGMPSDNRHHAQTQSLIGFFVNSLALRAKLEPSCSVEALILQVHEIMTDAKIHQELPFENLVDLLEVERDSSRHPIYQVMFTLQSFGEALEDETQLPFSPLPINAEESVYSPAKFDLSLILSDGNDLISGSFNYAVSLFEATTIERIAQIYQRVLKAFVDDQQQSISQISTLSKMDKQKLMYSWNATDKSYPDNKSITELFSEQVVKNPNKIALRFEQQALTYQEVEQQSSQMAHHIRSVYQQKTGRALKSDTFIALYLDRTPATVISMLAVLKAGAAYVPISPEDPQQRAEYIFQDTKASLVLTQKKYISQLHRWVKDLQLMPCLLDIEDQRVLQQYPDTTPQVGCQPESLAYVIYTSGTTGQPKGVLVEQRSVAAFVFNDHYINRSNVERIASLSPYSFDGFVFDSFYSLLQGATCSLFSKQTLLDMTAFSEQLNAHKIDSFFTTTALFNQLIAHRALDNSQVKNVLFGGESADINMIQMALKIYPKINFIHVYGPTETVVFSTAYHFESDTNRAPIGSPINNKKLYVLDETGQPVNIGTPGELYIGGEGVARGYLNQTELTAQKFIDDPFSKQQESFNGKGKNNSSPRLYKTGDIVRWLSDGNIEFIGRNDSQIKIRGHRIECGEIEAALCKLSAIKQALVIVKGKSSAQYLAAYVVLNKGVEQSLNSLREELVAYLPAYSIPSAFCQIDELPLNNNGKIDIKALPEASFIDGDSYTAPRNELEEKLCQVWQDVLGLEKVGIHDNFFRIGGNSIMAIQLTSASRREMGMDIPLALLFEYKTIAGLASQMKQQNMLIIPKLDLDKAPLSFAQERLLFIERFEQGSDSYHIPLLMELTKETDIAALEHAFNYVIERHSVLKSVYLSDQKGVSYQSKLAIDFKLNFSRLQDQTQMVEVFTKATATPFDLTSEPSIRLQGYQVSSRHYLSIIWHHIAFDGWSTEIFLQELGVVYQAVLNGELPQLPELEIEYKDYAAWQKDYLQGEILQELLSYWESNLAGFESLRLPLDRVRPAKQDYRGKDLAFNLNADLSERLRALAKSQDTTLYTVLLSAFYTCLSTVCGQKDVVIGMPSDNRHHAQTQALVGFFVNSLALRHQVDSDASVTELIKQVHSVVTQAKIHQELPFENLVDALNVERDPSRHPIYQVMFSVQSFGESQSENTDLPFLPALLDSEQAEYSPAKYDLSLFLTDGQSEICGSFNYALSLFDSETIKSILSLYTCVLEAFVSNQYQLISQIALVNDSEREKLISLSRVDLQQSEKSAIDTTLSIGHSFSAQANSFPNQTALVVADERINYRQLDERSNQMARLIQQKSEGGCVALLCDGSVAMVVGLIAILKSGAVCVSISADAVRDEVKHIFKHIIKDIKPTLVLGGSATFALYQNWIENSSRHPQFINLDDDFLYNKLSTQALNLRINLRDVACVMYPSTKTQAMAGIEFSQYALVKQSEATNQRIGLANNSKMLHSLDLLNVSSLTELLYGLLYGQEIHYYGSIKANEFIALGEQIETQNIEFATLSSLTLSHLNPRQLDSLKVLQVKGHLSQQEVLALGLDNCKVINIYPNDLAGDCAVIRTALSHDLQDGAPIQSASSTLQIKNDCSKYYLALGDESFAYILDANMNLLPVGIAGDLYIGGPGLASECRRDLSKLSTKLVKNECFFDELTGKNAGFIFKANMRARWTINGDLELVSNTEALCKIGENIVNLNDIESAIKKHAQTKYVAVVAVSENNQSNRVADASNGIDTEHTDLEKTDLEKTGTGLIEQHLAAYLMIRKGQNFCLENLRTKLLAELPSYMIPRTFNLLESLPATKDGFLDKNALPKPQFVEALKNVAPRTSLEEKLLKVWRSVFIHQEELGIHENYFKIGGNSITAIRLANSCQQALNIELPVTLIFETQTIAKLAERLSQNTLNSSEQLDKQYLRTTVGIVDVKDKHLEKEILQKASCEIFPLTSTQNNWISHTHRHPGDEAWWISTVLKVDQQVVTKAANGQLLQAWKNIAKTVPALRTKFHFEGERSYQIVDEKARIGYSEFSVENLQQCQALLAEHMAQEVDVTQDPLLRIFVFSTTEGYAYHGMLVHHVLVDGWSFSDVIGRVYANLMSPETILSFNSDSGVSYVEWQLKQDRAAAEKFWQSELNDLQETVPLLLKGSYQKRRRVNVCQPEFSLSMKESEQLYCNAKQHGVTPYIYIEAAWAATLAKLTNQEIVYFTTLDSGRSINLENISSLTFNTLTALPGKFVVENDSDTLDMLQAMHQKMLSRQANGHVDLNRTIDNYHQQGFGSLLIYQNIETGSPESEQESSNSHSNKQESELQIKLIEAVDKYDPCTYKISMVINPNEQISGFFEYFTTDFEKSDFATIQLTFENKLKQLIMDTTVLQQKA